MLKLHASLASSSSSTSSPASFLAFFGQVLGSNLARFEYASDWLLCRYGSETVAQTEEGMPANTTDPIDALENVVHATFINATAMKCATPRREPGEAVPLYLSTSGLSNFSSSSVTLTYYNNYQDPEVSNALSVVVVVVVPASPHRRRT